jgi:hypothetical protein
MPKFQIVSPHLPSECLQAMDEILARNPEFLEEAWNGCDVGDHTIYAVVDADAAEEARERIPAFIRRKTRVVEVKQVTPEQIVTHRDEVLRSHQAEMG